MPLPLLVVVRRLDALDALDELAAVDQSQQPRLPAALRLATSSGALLSVHATRLRDAVDDRSVALTIAPAAGVERVSLLLATHGLTAAQRRVAELVLRGHTTRQIVVELQISAHTVQDHLKAVFDKTGVRSRRELVTAMMQPPGS